MKKLNIGVLFLLGSGQFLFSQVDSVASKEKQIEGVILRGNTNKKTEAAVIQEQKKAVVQKQAVSAEEISRKGVSNVEQGLTKVTGITTVEGRGLFVRGLEERYNYLLVNGLGTPSNNPFQKIVALKQFPTDVVGKLNIYKTFNANLYGDFAGATFDVETLTLDKPFSKIEFGIGVNTLSTFRNDFLVAEGTLGMKGYTGLNSEDRKLPSQIRNNRPERYRFMGQESINSFKNAWNTEAIKTLPDTNLGFTTAQKFGAVSLLLSLNQGNTYTYREGLKNQFLNMGDAIYMNNNLQRKQYTYETETSALLGLGYKKRKTQINFNTIYLQDTNNIIEDFYGYRNNEVQKKDIGFFRVNQMDISKFWATQLIASQKINDRHQLKAGVSYVMNNYSQPDRKILEGSRQDQYGNQLQNNQLYMAYGGNNLLRQYLDVNSKFYASAFGEYTLGLGNKGDRRDYPIQFTLGYNGFADVRKNSYRFIFARPQVSGQGFIVDKNNLNPTFQNDIINGRLFYLEESDAYSYLSNMYQFVNAGYATLNLKPNESWDILIGGRYEKDQSLIRYNRPGESRTRNILKDRDFILPSLSIKKAIDNKNNIRLSVSQTITRPVLIETMPIVYINPDNENIQGNAEIKNSENLNLDLKWEYFPTNKEMLSVNVFAKQVKNAIERAFISSAFSGGTVISFLNAEKAHIAGVELEGMLSLKRLTPALERFSLGANATFMYTNVHRSPLQLEMEKPEKLNAQDLRKRGLQGAAPYTINADIKYEMKNKNNLNRTLSLVYNVSGEKIFVVGVAGTDSLFEKPYHQLDFVYQEQFNKHWNIKFGVKNILNDRYDILLGKNNYLPMENVTDYTYTNYYRGITFNATIGYTF